VAAFAAVGLAVGAALAEPAGPAQAAPPRRPTVVLVHGAWADSGSWDGVVARLRRDGYPVIAFPTPLASLSGDSSALRSYLRAIGGPVVLVGHSYGGAVVSDAATGERNVRALVYLDAFAPARGETVTQLAGPTSVLANPDPAKVFSFVPAASPTPATELTVRPEVFPGAFAPDLPAGQAAVLAVTQRPITLGALNEPSTTPAWLTVPSWYEVGTIDRVIPEGRQLAMARRAHAHIVETRTGHLPMVSRPDVVTRAIESAAAATD
jgi:pimeloyl-ACP methyl ester carboxylesterase